MILDIDPRTFARWLQVALKQRKRAHTKMARDYGPQSAAANAILSDITDLQTLIDTCLRAAAPLRGSPTMRDDCELVWC
jgi:hypothetical protein